MRQARVGLTTVIAMVALGALPAAGLAQRDLPDVSLPGDAWLRVDDAGAFNSFGTAVAAAGDVNGDGLGDVLVGAVLDDFNGRAGSGSAYVLYGRMGGDPAVLDLATDLGTRGFRMDGATERENAGYRVARAGDLNGDGRDDLVVTAPWADPHGRVDAGTAYVVYGQGSGDPPDLDLAALGARGFSVDGATAGEHAGYSVAPAGDINGDGRGDLIVGAPEADNNGRTNSGSTYVVYGRAGGGDPADVDLADLGARGFRIDGSAADDRTGTSSAGPGDLNGDGRDDVVLGAPSTDRTTRSAAGAAFVVYGEAEGGDPADLDLAALGTRGFRIDGGESLAFAGGSVSAAGDANGDGRDDVVVGALGADYSGRNAVGTAYVIYGVAAAGDVADLDLLDPGARGFRVIGADASDLVGWESAEAGDVNGDGRGDLILGAPGADDYLGAAYVVYGQATGDDLADLDLAAGLGARGFRIAGSPTYENTAHAVGGAGDFNGDGRDDVIVGAPDASHNDRRLSGSAYVLVGPDWTAPAVTCEPPPNFELGATGATVSATVSDVNSGPTATEVSAPAQTTTAGRHTVALTGTDKAGNTTTVDCAFTVAGPPTPPAPPAPPKPAPVRPPVDPLPLECSKRTMVLLDVLMAGRKVRVRGIALQRLAGRSVTIRLAGRAVGSTVIAADGSFSALVPAPARRLRNRARYDAQAGTNRTRALRLVRHLVIDKRTPVAGGLRLQGRFTGPRRSIPRTAQLFRQTSCTSKQRVGTVRIRRDGRFSVRLSAPAAVERYATYRLVAPVRGGSIFTLPILVPAA